MKVGLRSSRNKVLEETSETKHQKVFKQTLREIAVGEEGATATKFAEILKILSDGRWHLLDEIRQKTKLNDSQIQRITEFLKEYEFITIDETKKEMRLEKVAKKFLA